MDAGWQLVKGSGAPVEPPAAAGAGRRCRTALLPRHVVTVDAGHGGVDPGNPGVFFPAGMKEKRRHAAGGLLLRDELRRAASPCG